MLTFIISVSLFVELSSACSCYLRLTPVIMQHARHRPSSTNTPVLLSINLILNVLLGFPYNECSCKTIHANACDLFHARLNRFFYVLDNFLSTVNPSFSLSFLGFNNSLIVNCSYSLVLFLYNFLYNYIFCF